MSIENWRRPIESGSRSNRRQHINHRFGQANLTMLPFAGR
ncbi:hypothetical protein Arad_7011 [Rhizobium rhizogenes K84]|uniref:Uncharacterized protein n=1 Tax=Rhizobium rhizogenes (strain K84 / ATCC BAA-868) TaxID=311403 RepID=B9JLA2_RHIR8|nr:hypothetical protein Arad_7011 [Rhizobium rhizogenes K84]